MTGNKHLSRLTSSLAGVQTLSVTNGAGEKIRQKDILAMGEAPSFCALFLRAIASSSSQSRSHIQLLLMPLGNGIISRIARVGRDRDRCRCSDLNAESHEVSVSTNVSNVLTTTLLEIFVFGLESIYGCYSDAG